MIVDLSNPKHAVGLVSAVALALVALHVGAKRGFPLVKRAVVYVSGKFSSGLSTLKRRKPAVGSGKQAVLNSIAIVSEHFESRGDAKTVAALADMASRVLTEPAKVGA